MANCLVCRLMKIPCDKTSGLLRPLAVPERTWQHLVVDFKSMPPDAGGDDFAFVIIDRLSKRYYIVRYSRDITTKAIAKLYYYSPLRYIGLPKSITSDYSP